MKHHLTLRDLIAFPFSLLTLLFVYLQLKIGGKYTTAEAAYTFKKLAQGLTKVDGSK